MPSVDYLGKKALIDLITHAAAGVQFWLTAPVAQIEPKDRPLNIDVKISRDKLVAWVRDTPIVGKVRVRKCGVKYYVG